MLKEVKPFVSQACIKTFSLCLILFWAVESSYAQYQSREYIYEGGRLIAIEEAPTTLLAAGLRDEAMPNDQGSPLLFEEVLLAGIGSAFTPGWAVTITTLSACMEVVAAQAALDGLLAQGFQFRPLIEATVYLDTHATDPAIRTQRQASDPRSGE